MLDKSEITKQTPEKSLTESKKRTGGRNSHGEITSWHRGGGHARRFRSIDFRREKIGIPAKVASIEYDPNRSARIALLHYADGEKRYILQPIGLEVGMTVQNGEGADILPGNALTIRHIPPGTKVHNLELFPGKGAQVVRAAGGAAQLLSKEGDFALVKLPSGEVCGIPAQDPIRDAISGRKDKQTASPARWEYLPRSRPSRTGICETKFAALVQASIRTSLPA